MDLGHFPEIVLTEPVSTEVLNWDENDGEDNNSQSYPKFIEVFLACFSRK